MAVVDNDGDWIYFDLVYSEALGFLVGHLTPSQVHFKIVHDMLHSYMAISRYLVMAMTRFDYAFSTQFKVKFHHKINKGHSVVRLNLELNQKGRPDNLKTSFTVCLS